MGLARVFDDRSYEVELDGFECEFVRLVAGESLRRKVGGVGWSPVVGRSRWGLGRELDWVGAEMAFAKLFNVYPRFGRGCKGWDLVLWDGRTVDVKQTVYEVGYLACPVRVRGSVCDVYVLMVGRFPRYVYKGWVSGEELVREENLRKLDGWVMPAYVVSQDRLRLEL